MATVVTVNKEYSPQVSGDYYVELVASAETLRLKAAKFLTGIKKSQRIPNFALEAGLKRRQECASEPAGSYTMDSKVIEVCKLDLHNKICHADFESIYNDGTIYEYRGSGAMVRNIPELQNRIFMDLLRQHVALDIEKIIWSGDNDNGGYEAPNDVTTLCDGWLKRYLDAGQPNSFGPIATSDPQAIGNVGVDNIIDVFSGLVKLLPIEVYQNIPLNDGIIIYAAADFWKFMQAAVNEYKDHYSGQCPIQPTSNQFVWSYNGIPIVFTKGINAGGNGPGGASMICTFRDNLWCGMDAESDITNFRIVNNAQIRAADFTTEYYGAFNIGTQIRNENYISSYISQ